MRDVRLLEAKLGKSLEASGEYRFLCPFCMEEKGSADKKHHLYFNPENGKWICFRCDSRGSRNFLFKKLGIDTDSEEEKPPNGIEALEEVVSGLESSKLLKTLGGPIYREIQYPCEVGPIAPGTDAYTYLRYKRKWSKDKIYHITNHYEMVTGYHVYDNRIFIPTYDVQTEKMVFWVARSTMGNSPNLAKYVNPKDIKKDMVFNLDKAVHTGEPWIIICEGVFSAIACGKSGVAIYGKTATRDQINTLCENFRGLFIVALDGDAKREAYNLANEINSRGKLVSIATFPDGEDPDSVGDPLEYIIESVPFSFSGSMSWIFGNT